LLQTLLQASFASTRAPVHKSSTTMKSAHLTRQLQRQPIEMDY